MKYAVIVMDPNTGKVCAEDGLTSKAHARRRANEHNRNGIRADIIQEGSDCDGPLQAIKCAFNLERRQCWELVGIAFAWYSAEGEMIETNLSARDLYLDWYGECKHCPENETNISNIRIGGVQIPNGNNGNFCFNDLMTLIEETWPRVKVGRPINPNKQMASRMAVPGRKRSASACN